MDEINEDYNNLLDEWIKLVLTTDRFATIERWLREQVQLHPELFAQLLSSEAYRRDIEF
jgi:hypothetical protein